ncbi:uracil-xanthine permease family protein [Clostridium thailandense]|uniref:Purine permease n=1 Tax=Clostridium thailandense TaxID=2794346 RepID=A0A949U407_9CLOT|nr:nucleobase:cation symporter-2 family protein [Clostridium thailandense]MBV7276976.1 purine permease [Clostridium thailandense]
MDKEKNSLIYKLDGTPPLGTSIPLGLQHVLAMFVGNVAPIIIISGALKLPVEQKAFLIQCAMFVAGIASLIQAFPLGPIGARLPIIMGTSFGFLAVCLSIAGKYGLPGVLGAALVGGIFQIFLGFFLKHIRKFFPPIVTGIVLLAIGLSLIKTGMTYFAGGAGAKDFGSMQNLILGTIVLVTIVVVQYFTKGVLSKSSILIGLIVGYIAALMMGKISFASVATASWFAIPRPLQFGFEFHLDAILSICVIYMVSTVETVGNVCGIAAGGIGRAATDKEISGSVVADGVGSIFAALFNVLPTTSYGQNVGIITMTKIVNRFTVATGAMFLIICGLFPKIGAVIAVMPSSVLGGAAVVMFSMMIVSGINQVTEAPLQGRNATILAVSLGVGVGFALVPDACKYFNPLIKMLFEGSGVAIAAALSVFLNIVLPKEKTSIVEKKAA